MAATSFQMSHVANWPSWPEASLARSCDYHHSAELVTMRPCSTQRAFGNQNNSPTSISRSRGLNSPCSLTCNRPVE